MHSLYLQHTILGNYRTSFSVEMKSDLRKRMSKAFLHYIRLRILWMKMVRESERMKAMRKTIFLESMMQFQV